MATRAGARRPRRSMPATLFMLGFLVYFLLPLFWLFVASTKSASDLFDSFGLWFAHDFDLVRNIKELFAVRSLDGGSYLLWIRNSMLYSVSSAVIAALVAAAAGYGFGMFRFRGREALFWLVLGSVMVPTQALATPTFLLFAQVGLTNSPWSIILPSSVSPFGV